MRSFHLIGLAAALAVATGCATPDQRYFYRKGIDAFAPKIPRSSTKCWLTPDLVGPGAGSNAIAEEVFTDYLIEKGLCTLVEKHPDAVAGYTWPQQDLCPCAAGTAVCPTGACPGASGAPAAGPSLGGFGGIGGEAGDDNNRSGDKLLERYKKRSLPDKLIVYRIDELKQDKATIWFRISDARTTTVEAAQTIFVEKEKPAAPAEGGAPPRD